MPINILMPALSPTMEKGNLAKWHVKEGDTVKSGDIIAEIETDKATMEYEAVDEGKIGKILVAEGTSDVDVNQPIAVLLEEGEEAEAAEQPAPKAAEAKTQDAPPTEVKPTEAASSAKAPAGGEKAAETRQAPAPKASEKGYGVAAPGASSAEAKQPATNGASGERVFASPLARRIAKEKGIDLSAVAGSGPHGRIVQRDVEGAKAGAKGAPGMPAPGSAQPGAGGGAAPVQAPSDKQIKAFFEDGSYEEVPNDGMRKTIARRLLESKLTIPHFYLSLDCEIDALLSLRAQVNAVAPKEGSGAYKLSVNDFVIKAMAMALQKVPAANATWTEAATLRHKHSDVGVAVAIEGGLFTPVIRKAETKTLSVISAEMKDYAARARSKKLKPAEYLGGTTSVSNLGMYGIREFAAVINPPHSTILAVGAGEKRAVVKDDAVKVATVMTATLSCDHRAVDGALGAELLSAFKEFIESPMSMLV